MQTFTEAEHQLNSKRGEKAKEVEKSNNEHARMAVRRFCKHHIPTGAQQGVADELMEILGLV